MKELVYVTKDILAKNNMLKKEALPIEKILNEFSSENGCDMLTQCFGCVTAIDYLNTLIFQPGESETVIEYFLFKSPFLLTETNDDVNRLAKLLLLELQQNTSILKNGFSISKNDRIFISSSPLKGIHAA